MFKKFSVNIPDNYIKQIDKFIESGLYISRNEAIRNAIYDLIWDEI
ncbi:MAG: ribbon-helix-helix domain-containing protein [Candidatus Helarchaeota archaeon]